MPGVINLAEKYEDTLLQALTKPSYTKGNATDEYDFEGVRSINVLTVLTQPLNDYDRTASGNRFGTPTEAKDDLQELTMQEDKGFSITIDKGNYVDQKELKKALTILKAQIDEQVVPYFDRHALASWTRKAGIKAEMAEPTEANIKKLIRSCGSAMDNGLVPDDDRVIYLPVTMYDKLMEMEDLKTLQTSGEKALVKGEMGTLSGMKIIKVPDMYFPEDVYFLGAWKKSVILPTKIEDTHIHTKTAGISGALLEGRYYSDAFVLGRRAAGVYAAVKTGSVVKTPEIKVTDDKATITAAAGALVYYTTDGSDPRYSKNAKVYAAPVELKEGQILSACAKKDELYESAVAKFDTKAA